MKKLRLIAKMLAAVLIMVLCIGAAAPAYADTTDSQAAGNTTSKKIVRSNSDFNMIVNCGIDGYAAYDTPTRVDITVECAKDFTGSVRLIPNADGDSWDTIVAYEQDITLVKGEAKTFTFYPASMGDSGKMKIVLLDEKRKEIYSETDKATLYYRGDSLMIGVLSDDYTALNYMDGLNVQNNYFYGKTTILELTESNFPENQDALSGLTYIIIDNYDTAKLSEKQYTALKNWVNNGGVLILGLGANYQNVLHIFTDDFVSGTLGELKKDTVTWKNVLAAVEEPVEGQEKKEESGETEQWFTLSGGSGEASEISLDNVDILEFTMADGEELGSFSTNRTAYKKLIGQGAVVVLSYDLAMEPIVSFSSRNALAASLLGQSATDSTFAAIYQNTNYYDTSGGDVASIQDATKRPNAIVLAVILLIYIVLAGPILYLILKKVNKREIIWGAIPVTALIFTFVIFLFAMSYQIGNPIINTFTIVELNEGVQNEQVYTSVICPKAKEYEILLNENYSDLQYSNSWNYNFWELEREKEYDYMLRESNEGLKMVLNNDSVFKNTVFSLSKTSDNAMGNLDLDLHCYTNGFEGTVTNNTIYDLENVVVYFEDHYCQAGDLKKGESASFELKDNQDFSPYGTFDWYNFSNNILDRDNTKYIKARIDSLMEETYVNNYYQTGVHSYQLGGVWAYIPGYQVNVSKSDNVQQSGSGAVYQSFVGEYEDVTGTYIPDISMAMVKFIGDYDPMDNMMYTEIVELTYEFDTEDRITSLTNKNYSSQNSSWGYYQNYGDVYAYNVETDMYDRIFVDSAVLEGEQLKKYLNGNTLILRYETGEVYDAYIPTISALGGE